VKRILGMVALLGMVLVAGSCSHKAQTTAVQTVRFALPRNPDSLVVTFAQEKGWYREEGLDVQFTMVEADKVQETLASGAVDVAWSSTTSTMIASIKNPNVVYVSPWNTFDKGFALIARPNGPLKSVDELNKSTPSYVEAVRLAAAQLSGKTVITTANTDMERAVASAVARGDLLYKNVRIIDLPPDEGLAAFLSGKGDAYLGGIPQRTRAVQQGMVEVLSGFDLGPAPINGLVTSRAYLKDHEDVLMKIMKVWFRTATYTNSHTAEVGAYIAAQLNRDGGAHYDVADFSRDWNGLEHFVDSPQYAQNDIFDRKGNNYWRRRWDEDNKYYYITRRSTPYSVSSDGIFVADTMQIKFIQRYGKGPF
jgi:ABC-type nitrate/sulfonate/bicarbonate transport system substrate-binding protein